MKRVIGHYLLKLMGWKILGDLGSSRKKVLLLGPHTSGWDLFIGILVKYKLEVKHVHFAAKQSLFSWPFKFFWQGIGAIPVDRSKGNDTVSQLVDFINTKEDIIFCLAPEGTRKKTSKFKTGYYRIAKECKLPLILAAQDFKNKELRFKIYNLTEDREADLKNVMDYFRGVIGKNPERSFT